MLTPWDSFLAKHRLQLHPTHGDTGCQTRLVTPSLVEYTCRLCSHQINCVDLFYCQVWAAQSPLLAKKNHCSFLTLCSYFMGPPTSIFQIFRLPKFQSIIYRLCILCRALTAPSLESQPSSRAKSKEQHLPLDSALSVALRLPCTNLYLLLQSSRWSPGLWLCDPALAQSHFSLTFHLTKTSFHLSVETMSDFKKFSQSKQHSGSLAHLKRKKNRYILKLINY